MLRMQALRNSQTGFEFPPDSHYQKEFEALFPYEETPDQLTSIQEVKHDMRTPQPMDRLICGDVGYGKTEVAMRAAFKAIDAGKQVAILVPTTVLAEQHFRSFSERMAEFPVTLDVISRFRTSREQRTILEKLEQGKIDLIIGTHRLVQKDIRFKNLGLVIIDEEQRFGVEHKELLKQIRLAVDVLTLSATPIPHIAYVFIGHS
ncbi:MAG: DEAD/DEAH box helicase [Planctomycetaceae bacterium]